MKKIFLLIVFCSISVSSQTLSQLKKDIEAVIKSKRVEVGLYISGTEKSDTLSINGTKKYPMQSVFKFHIAIVVLSEVAKGKLSLDQKIDITKEDLKQNTWSPIRDDFPDGTKMTLGDVIYYTVAASDNIGCDLLLNLIGGTKVVDNFYKNLNITGISIQKNEEEMHEDEKAQFENWITPKTSNQILSLFYAGEILKAPEKDFLWKIMTETPYGAKRIRGLLREETIVGHKTGSSGVNAKNISVASNDIGIIVLKSGKFIIASFFVYNSPEKPEVNDSIIADITRLAVDYFAENKQAH